MCRWIAYSGQPIYLDTLITRPAQSLVEQSLNSRMSFRSDGSVLPTNGDGFGMGWYSDKHEPGLFKVPDPAWSNHNINELCAHLKSGMFMAHIRAASTGAIQRTNAHPFKCGQWLFQHNGYINQFETLKRDLQFAIAPEYYGFLQGTTDSETFFLLALTYGLKENPKAALEAAITRVHQAMHAHKAGGEMIFSCAMSDGKTLYSLRYSHKVKAHSQYYSTRADCMRDLDKGSDLMPRNSVVVVSEPLDHSLQEWDEMPLDSFATFRGGEVTIEPLEIHA